MQHLVIVGGGFAGVWAALGAARTRQQQGRSAADLAITLVSRDPWLTIRPRLYETSLDHVRVPLDAVTGPAGVNRISGEVTHIDPHARTIAIDDGGGLNSLRYDRLVLAAGSRLHRANIPGAELAFSVDSYHEALDLHGHLAALADPGGTTGTAGRFTAVVVGAGFTGIEVATTLISTLRTIAATTGSGERARLVLVERARVAAPDLGSDARMRVEQALASLGVELRTTAAVTAVHRDGVMLNGGEWIPAATTVWTGGFRASDLAAHLPVARDDSGRLPVDPFLRVRGMDNVFAAGDIARAMADDDHVAPMSCQYAIPMGEQAGANAVADLLGLPAVAFAQPDYVTCLDLGDAGALFMEGWDRNLKLTGVWAKRMKQTINTRLIYPPQGEWQARSAA